MYAGTYEGTYICTHVRRYIPTYRCTYLLLTYVFTHVRPYLRMHVTMYVPTYVLTYVRKHVVLSTYVLAYVHIRTKGLNIPALRAELFALCATLGISGITRVGVTQCRELRFQKNWGFFDPIYHLKKLKTFLSFQALPISKKTKNSGYFLLPLKTKRTGLFGPFFHIGFTPTPPSDTTACHECYRLRMCSMPS